MKDINLDHTHMAEFGNTTRDVLLKIDLDKEIANRKIADDRIVSDANVYYAKNIVITHTPERGHVLFELLNYHDEVISTQELDLPTEHIITRAVLADDLSDIKFYSDYQAAPEYICDLSKLVATLELEKKNREENDEALEAKLDAEIARATAEEDDLREEIEAEDWGLKDRVTNLENDLAQEVEERTNAVNAEQTRAEEAETVLTNNLAAENARAVLVESNLFNRLNEEIVTRSTEDTRISNEAKTNLDAETERATTAETVLAENLSAEATRAIAAETELLNKLNQETTRATNAETALDEALAAHNAKNNAEFEKVRNELAQASESLSNKVAAEETRAKQEEAALNQIIAAESSRAMQAETTLNEALAQEADERKQDVEKLDSDIYSEETRASERENELEILIYSEIRDRAAAINQEIADRNTAIKNAIDDEAAARIKAVGDEQVRAVRVEASLSQTISKEIVDRIADTDALKQRDTAISDALIAETSRATEAETELKNTINALDLDKVENTTGFIRTVSQKDGQVEATAKSFDTTIVANTADNSTAPTTKAVVDFIKTLDYSAVGAPGSYISKVSEADGIIAVEKTGFDTTINDAAAANDNNTASTKAIKTYVDNSIQALDVTEVGSDGNYIKKVSETDGKISVTKQAFDTSVTESADNANAPTTKAVKTYVDAEQTRAEEKEADLALAISAEEARAKDAENNLDTELNAEIVARKDADKAINDKIPSQASATNQLADKEFVNSSISTNTANFKGTFDKVADLPTTNITNNDYAYIKIIDDVTKLVKQYDRYKYVAASTEWKFEYTLNNSSFTAEQWAAINSGITSDKIEAIDTAITNEATRATTAEGNLSEAIEDEAEARAGADTALETKIDNHIADKENPHEVTKAQVGLDQVDNTSDANKPISTATQAALDALTTRVDGVYTKDETNTELAKKQNNLTAGDGIIINNDEISVDPEVVAINENTFVFENDLETMYTLGRYNGTLANPVTIPVKNKTFAEAWDIIFKKEENPSTTQPSVSIKLTNAGAYEAGTKITPAYTTTFSAGSYTYGPATGVTADDYKIKFNDETLTTDSGTFTELTVGDGTSLTISGTFDHTAGSTPVTNLGNPYEAGKIVATNDKNCSVNANYNTISGYRNMFFGTLDAKTALVSSTIRGLANKVKTTNLTQQPYDIPVGALRVVFAVPSTKKITSILDINGLGAEIFSSFTQTTVHVAGANSYLTKAYTVYYLDYANPNDTANEYKITVTNA